jgi:hypothetical protein
VRPSPGGRPIRQRLGLQLAAGGYAHRDSTRFQELLIGALNDHPCVPTEGWECKAQFDVRVDNRTQIPDLIFYQLSANSASSGPSK